MNDLRKQLEAWKETYESLLTMEASDKLYAILAEQGEQAPGLKAMADDIAAHIWTDALGKRGDYDGWSADKGIAAKLILEGLIASPAPSPAIVDPAKTEWGQRRNEMSLTCPGHSGEGQLRKAAQKVANRFYKMLENGCECDADGCVCGYNAAMHEWAELDAALQHSPEPDAAMIACRLLLDYEEAMDGGDDDEHEDMYWKAVQAARRAVGEPPNIPEPPSREPEPGFRDATFNKALDRIAYLTDSGTFHGYRSEVWSVMAEVWDAARRYGGKM